MYDMKTDTEDKINHISTGRHKKVNINKILWQLQLYMYYVTLQQFFFFFYI